MSEELDYEDVAYGEGLEAGVKAERERVIKLLWVFSHNIKHLPMHQLIELIHGDNW